MVFPLFWKSGLPTFGYWIDKFMNGPDIKIRTAKERGHANYGWLNTYHTFSFGNYQDPQQMGFRCLRVINDDTIKPGMGFQTHSHKDMEIISYVIDGALEHKDSMGHGSVLPKGNFQRISAGTGIEHSEFNHLQEKSTHFLQIWVLPEIAGLKPSYEELATPELKGELALIAAQEPQNGVLTVHQDIEIYLGRFDEYETCHRKIGPGRGCWIQMVDGKIKINDDVILNRGDGVSIENVVELTITSLTASEFLLFDCA